MTRATIINGRTYAAEIRCQLAHSVGELRNSHHIVPGLAMLLVGQDSASQVYVRNKQKQAQDIGMHSLVRLFPEKVQKKTLLSSIEDLNRNQNVHGILVQLPLPAHMKRDTHQIISTIDPSKDVDGLHPCNAGHVFAGSGTGITPCTPLGCLRLLRRHHPSLNGMRALVIGRSNIVGKPMAHLLVQENCTVTMAHSQTRDLPKECREADIVIAAAGQAEMIRGDWVRPGATVIDVGINHVPCQGQGGGVVSRLVGDVCFAEVVEVADAVTPVPGGVGPMTIAMLLRNTLLACLQQVGVEKSFCA